MKYCPTFQGFRLASRVIAAALAIALLSTGCGFTQVFKGGTAKENSIRALEITTDSATLLMTAAGIAYNAGAFGQPGSDRAEDTWAKIAEQSLLMHGALKAWSTAIKENKDAPTYSFAVSQALAVIGALMPTKKKAEITAPSAISPYTFTSITFAEAGVDRLASPDSFREFAYGGAL